jgi:hypothetical protein
VLILDLDLDYFVAPKVERNLECARLDEDVYKPWPEEQFRAFLEKSGLSLRDPVPGCVVRHHDEAFYWWRGLLKAGELTSPFDVIHVDAHSDLGMGDGGFVYVMTELLHRPVEGRSFPRREEVLPGNYLLFAVACRWIRQLTLVQNQWPRDDLPRRIFHDENPATGIIELSRYDRIAAKRSMSGGAYKWDGFLDRDPQTQVVLTAGSQFRSDRPSFALLAQSPDYTPLDADPLLDVFREYIIER